MSEISGTGEVSEANDELLCKIASSAKGLVLLLASIGDKNVHASLSGFSELDNLIKYSIVNHKSVRFGKNMAACLYEISFDPNVGFTDTLFIKLKDMLDYVIGLTDSLPVGYFKLL